MQLLPQNEKFYEMLEQLSGHSLKAVTQLNTLVNDFPQIDKPAEEIEKEEQAADELTHSELEMLDKAFITPLDREDILHLMTDLYSVVATINIIAQRLKQYKLKSLDPKAVTVIQALQGIVECLNEIILHLRKGHQLSELNAKLQELHHLTRGAKGDLGKFLGNVFADADPLEAIKRKDIHDQLENVVDNCDKVSRTLQMVVLKNS